MRRFGLGSLRYSPERFGSMLVGDFLDTMYGYYEADYERLKGIAELIRTSTTILLNIHLGTQDKFKSNDLWPFPWDKQQEEESPGRILVDDEKVQKMEEEMEAILRKKHEEQI